VLERERERETDLGVHLLDLRAHTNAAEDLPTPSIINLFKPHNSRRKDILISFYRRKLQQGNSITRYHPDAKFQLQD
jgi:hypothetical protein